MPSYYEILGVAEDAGNEEIQAAYDKLQAQYYSELGRRSTHDEALLKLKQLNEARSVLLSAGDRQKYDENARREEEEKTLPPDPARRFLARCIDTLTYFVFFYPVYRYLADYVFFEDWALALELIAAGIAVYILLETAAVWALGTTLGKWMLSVTFTPLREGEAVTRKQLARRNLMAVLYGLALYIPPFCLVAMAIQRSKLLKGNDERRTGWDRKTGIGVAYGDIKGARLLFMLPVIVFVIIDIINIF